MIPDYINKAALEYKAKHGNRNDVYEAFIAGYKATKKTKAKYVELTEQQEMWFEKAWEAYGRKGSKGDAKKEWAEIPETDYQEILQHISAYVATREFSYQKDFERYLKSKTYTGIVCKGNNIMYAPQEKKQKSLSERFAAWVDDHYPCLKDMEMPTDEQLNRMLSICHNKIEVYLDRLSDDHHEGSLYDLFEERFVGDSKGVGST